MFRTSFLAVRVLYWNLSSLCSMILIVVIDVKTSVRKFMYLMDKILDRELELGDGEIDINEDVEIPQEYFMPRSIISSLCTEIAKMKSSGMLVTVS